MKIKAVKLYENGFMTQPFAMGGNGETANNDRLSVVFEDYDAALDTLKRVRQFIKENPTVYVSTHTPLGYENLEAKRVVDLDNMPEPIPPKDIKAAKATGKYVCSNAMFDNFPEPVMITQRSREMIAVNKKAASFGLNAGIKCSSIGKPENHRGCLCNRAVDSGEPVYIQYQSPFGKAFGYWIPIPDKPEWIIHFGVGGSFDYVDGTNA